MLNVCVKIYIVLSTLKGVCYKVNMNLPCSYINIKGAQAQVTACALLENWISFRPGEDILGKGLVSFVNF